MFLLTQVNFVVNFLNQKDAEKIENEGKYHQTYIFTSTRSLLFHLKDQEIMNYIRKVIRKLNFLGYRKNLQIFFDKPQFSDYNTS